MAILKHAVVAGLLATLLSATPARALEVSAVQVLERGAVVTRVFGRSTSRFADILMEGVKVAQSDANGRFNVTTPMRGFGCIALFEDDDSAVRVRVGNCDSTVLGYYVTDQATHTLPAQSPDPGFTIPADGTPCDPGDLAVNWDGGSPVDFAIRYSGKLRNGSTNQERWLLVVHSLAATPSTIAIGTLCADLWPLHGVASHRQPKQHDGQWSAPGTPRKD